MISHLESTSGHTTFPLFLLVEDSSNVGREVTLGEAESILKGVFKDKIHGLES